MHISPLFNKFSFLAGYWVRWTMKLLSLLMERITLMERVTGSPLCRSVLVNMRLGLYGSSQLLSPSILFKQRKQPLLGGSPKMCGILITYRNSNFLMSKLSHRVVCSWHLTSELLKSFVIVTSRYVWEPLL